MFLFGLMSQIFVYGSIGFLSPTLSLHLMEYPGFNEFRVGVFFAVPFVIYVINTPLVYIYCKIVSSQFVVFLGSAIFCLSIYFIGTSPIFGF